MDHPVGQHARHAVRIRPLRRGAVTAALGLLGALVAIAPAALAGDAGAASSAPQANAPAAPPPHAKVSYPTVATAKARRAAKAQGAVSAPLYYGGGAVVTGTPRVYLVFWGAQWGTGSGQTGFSNDPYGVAHKLITMYQGLGTNGESWSNVMAQYCQGVTRGATSCPKSAAHVAYPTGGALAGVFNDTSSTAPHSATMTDLEQEARRAAAALGADTSAAKERNAQYVIVSATGTNPDGFLDGQWCAWHSATYDNHLNTIAYTNLPYLPDAGAGCGAGYVNGGLGALDGVTIVAGHEYSETITDPNPPQGWTDDGYGEENADKCAWVGVGGSTGAQNLRFSTGSFAMQSTWSNSLGGCRIGQAPISPK